MQYLIAFCSQLEAYIDVMSGKFMQLVIRDNYEKLGDPRLNRFGEIRPKSVRQTRHFRQFFSLRNNYRPEGATYIIFVRLLWGSR